MRIAIFYATREGQTRRIAQHLAEALIGHGVVVDLYDVANLAARVDLAPYDSAIVAASVHVGKHEREMIRFVNQHREQLEAMPTTFLSVSMASAGIGDPARTDEQRQRALAEVTKNLENFYHLTQWHPTRTVPIAGALLYTKYNFLIRFIIKMIAKQSGASTDTSRDHEYTDWAALDRFADELSSATS